MWKSETVLYSPLPKKQFEIQKSSQSDMLRLYLSTVYNIFISENLSIGGVAVMVKNYTEIN